LKTICKTFFVLASVLVQLDFAMAQHMWQVGGGKNDHWYFMDGDEFAEAGLKTSLWENSYPWGRSLYCSNDPHYYTDGLNLHYNSGVITLEARKESITEKAVPYESNDYELQCDGKPMGKKNLMNFQYTAGMLFSKKKYTYGYFEIRFRSDEGSGLWPAFWLYAGKDNYEIDIFEIVGSRNEDFHVDMHCPSGCKNYKTTLGLLRKNWGDYIQSTENWKDGYNVIGVEWQPSYVKWYLNGKGVAYWRGKFEHPMWLIADIAVSKDGGPFGPGPDQNTKFPARFDIDYIRMWSKTPLPNQVLSTFEGWSDPDAPRPPELKAGNANLVKKARPEYNKKALAADHIFATLAVATGGKWLVSITGIPAPDFHLSVTGKNGVVFYESKDLNVKEHYFLPVIAGEKHILKIRNNGTEISHLF
jgi:hypothetical protein